MGYLIAIASSIFIYYYYCIRLNALKDRLIELKKEIEMAEKDIWDRLHEISKEIAAIQVQIGKLEVKMWAVTTLAVFISNGLFQIALLFIKK